MSYTKDSIDEKFSRFLLIVLNSYWETRSSIENDHYGQKTRHGNASRSLVGCFQHSRTGGCHKHGDINARAEYVESFISEFVVKEESKKKRKLDPKHSMEYYYAGHEEIECFSDDDFATDHSLPLKTIYEALSTWSESAQDTDTHRADDVKDKSMPHSSFPKI